MKTAVTSIQRDRNPWILEWVAFHLCVGFDQIYIYSHKNKDGMNATIKKIAEYYPVVLHEIETDEPPQVGAYWDAIHNYLPETDWMAFIDGDEFLFPTQHDDIKDTLALFQDKPLSALAVYWVCYGSSGHVKDPLGLITENFTRHSTPDYHPNRFIKSTLKGRGQSQITGASAHFFRTDGGTFDEQMRQVEWHEGHTPPTYDFFRINHYITQSYDFYRYIKTHMVPPDGNINSVRTLDFFSALDRNDCDDGIRYSFLIKLKLKIEEIEQKLALNKKTFNKPTATYDISRMTYKG